MALLGEVEEDERGRELAERNTGLPGQTKPDGSHDQTGLSPEESAQFDQLAASAKNPKDSAPEPKSATPSPSSSDSSGGNRFSSAIKSAGAFAGGHKKGLGISGGVAALIVAGLIGLFGLLSDKLASLVANVYDHEMARAEHSIKQRATKIVLKQVYNKAINQTATSDNPLLQKLYNQIPLSKITDRLADEKVSFKGVDGKVRLTLPDGSTQDFANAEDFSNFFANDPKAVGARALVENATEDETHYLEVYQRHFLRLLMRNEFDIKNWKPFDNKTGDEASKEVTTDAEHAALDGASDDLASNVACATGSDGDCPETDDQRRFPDGDTPGKPTWESTNGEKNPTETPDTTTCDGGQSATACQTATESTATGDTKTFDDSFESELGASADNKVAADLAEKVEADVAKGTCEVCILNTASEVDDLLYNNRAAELIEAERSTQYAGLAANILSADSQIREGKDVSGDEVNDIIKSFDSTTVLKDGKKTVLPGAEQSNAFSTIFENDPTRGIKMDPAKMVGSGGGLNTANNVSTLYKETIGNTVHPFLAAYKATVGKILDWVSGVLGALTNNIPGMKSLNEFMAKYAGKLINYAIGSVVSGSETGTTLFNAFDAGTDVTANAFSRDSLGAPKVSATAYAQIGQQVALDNAQDTARQPLTQRLFDTSEPTSFASQLAARLPSSPGAGAAQAGSYLASLITNPIAFFGDAFNGHLFFGNAFAAAVPDPYGVQGYAYTDAQLDNPIDLPTGDIAGAPNADGSINTTADGQIDQNDCPQQPDANQMNECLLDTTALLSLTANSTDADNGGLGDAGSNQTPTSPVPSTPPVAGDGPSLARQILTLYNQHKITFQQSLDLRDIQDTANGTPITTCGLNGPLNASLLKVIIEAAQNNTFSINALDSGHASNGYGCDGEFHDKGRAVDIGDVNGVTATCATLGGTTYRTFAQYIVSILPSGGGIGQSQCIGPLSPPPTRAFNDTPNHIHVDVGATAP